MSDILRMDYINSLPQPFIATLIGGGGDWPVNDIEVETAILRIDVVGLLQVMCISEVKYFTDMDGVEHDPDTFFIDYEDQINNA